MTITLNVTDIPDFFIIILVVWLVVASVDKALNIYLNWRTRHVG